jgi:hypothetical protein
MSLTSVGGGGGAEGTGVRRIYLPGRTTNPRLAT